MYIRVIKTDPKEGLKEGDVVFFNDNHAAQAHIAAGTAVKCVRKVNPETGLFLEHAFEDVPVPAKE